MINIENMLDEIGETVEETSRLEREIERLRHENEKLAADSAVLDKIIKVVDGFDHNPDACMEDICEIIDERGD